MEECRVLIIAIVLTLVQVILISIVIIELSKFRTTLEDYLNENGDYLIQLIKLLDKNFKREQEILNKLMEERS
jgi:predicted PurR-regulated permease PerM